MECRPREAQIQEHERSQRASARGEPMSRQIEWATLTMTLAGLLVVPFGPRATDAQAGGDVPAWVKRGLPAEGHAALESLIGSWRVHKSIFGNMGGRPAPPPIGSGALNTT